MVPYAYLRVFHPVDALPEGERAGWERAVVGRPRPPRPTVYRQARTAHHGRLGLLTADVEGSEVRRVGDRWYVCPARTRLRLLASMLAIRDTVPTEVAEALVPEPEARRAARELARIRRRDPGAVPTVLQSAWHVPVRWFLLFEDPERRLTERDHGYAISYWAELPRARARVERAARVLARARLGDVAVIAREMGAWLSSFDRRAAVELDYAGVAAGLGWNELDDDHSAREVQGAVDALEAGDLEHAGELYQAVAGRWAEASVRQSLN